MAGRQLPYLDNGEAQEATAAYEADGLAHQTGMRLAEIGFLLILFAGIWLVAADVMKSKFGTARRIVAGIALAIAGLLLIIATHWGHFG